MTAAHSSPGPNEPVDIGELTNELIRSMPPALVSMPFRCHFFLARRPGNRVA